MPAPAVAVLLRGIPTAPLDETGKAGELTTPTGAALLAHFVNDYASQPPGRVVAVGQGAGSRKLADRANVLRALFIEPAPQEEIMDRDADRKSTEGEAGTVRRTASGVAGGVRRDHHETEPASGEGAAKEPSPVPEAEPGSSTAAMPRPAPGDGGATSEETETMPRDDRVRLDHVVLEANIDDMTPELLAHAGEVLRTAGALDVWMTQALMKKGRPGVVLHVLAAAADQRRVADLLFAETTTFGVRVVPVGRLYAEERRETVKLGGHEIGVRLSYVDGRPATVSPEYEDCRKAAEKLGRPAKVIYEAAQAAARARFSAG